MGQSLRSSETVIAALYSLAFASTLIPCYNWLYRVTVNLLHFVSFWVSLALIVLVVIPVRIYRRRIGKALLAITLGLLVLLAGSQVHSWRYSITEVYIASSFCNADASEADGLILGGIRRIELDGTQTTGAFINDSHCVSVVCAEEFYYCDDAAIAIEQ